MKKFIPFFISIAILAIALGLYYSIGCVRGSGNIAEKDFDVEEFNAIDLSLSSAILYLNQKETQSLRIEAEDNILERLKVNISGKKLKVSRSLGCLRYTEPVKIYVSLPTLTSITINGSAKLIGEDNFISDEMRININGSGELSLNLDVNSLETLISGSGKIQLSGRADQHNFKLTGSGELEAYDLTTNKSNVTISGSGKAEVVAIEDLNIKISGSGKVKYMGEPQNISQDISGSGTVEKIKGEIVLSQRGVNEEEIKKALALANPELDLKDAKIIIEDIKGAYVKGKISYKDNSLENQNFLGILRNEGWLTLLQGQTPLSCKMAEEYNFPIAFVPKCFNEETEEVIEREQREVRDVSDEDLLQQLDTTTNEVGPEHGQTIQFEAEPAE